MGMDVYGIKPKNERGEYFRASVWYWHPLWDCLENLHPKLCQKVEHPHDNSGDGLNARDSLALSKLFLKDLEDGTIKRYIDKYEEEINSIPDDDCIACDLTGYRTWSQEDGTSQVKVCNFCNGTLKTKSFATWYHMDYDLMVEFQTFLENCGGFQIC